jgi:hypothetical protein
MKSEIYQVGHPCPDFLAPISYWSYVQQDPDLLRVLTFHFPDFTHFQLSAC